MSAGKQGGNNRPRTSAEIRQSFLDFFAARGHQVVDSASLVPANDETLLFTNAGMVQFKDVFLGSGKRPYSRAVDSQKCLRVAGKHNDLDDVGRDDTHHTFFEMLGNWSFGDYYKEEAIGWAWELLTQAWGLPADDLYATCFKDELDEIPQDNEAAEIWRRQPGFNPDHVLFFGRDENFWEMADTGPCGPDSEIFLDQGAAACDRQHEAGHTCQINGDCSRYLELWNLVFIQYNRTGPNDLEPLPEKHVDTGMGFERIVSVLQQVDSNYRTDLFTPILDRVQAMAGHSDNERQSLFTPYRVIADHARAATFLIADGVVPGNSGRNYVCRMIIRRASRFGSYAGFEEPFIAGVAEAVMDTYGDAYPEVRRHRQAILDTITQEEIRFQRTVEQAVEQLEAHFRRLKQSGETVLEGEVAFDLYATYGLPLEITRDLAREQQLAVDESGFEQAMRGHRLVSGSGDDAESQLIAGADYRQLLNELVDAGELADGSVLMDPYTELQRPSKVLALLESGEQRDRVGTSQHVQVVLPVTPYYVESGGQVDDTGLIRSANGDGWQIRIDGVAVPVAGLVVHYGQVVTGEPAVGDQALAVVDQPRRLDIMRNHTATHLLHAALHHVLGDHARQAGSLVAPDRLRFDFNHGQAVTPDELTAIENWVNEAVLANLPLRVRLEARAKAIEAGAMALFGEHYDDQVRTISIGDDEVVSYELCGGTHVPETGLIGQFLILNESSAAAGIRRIEAITGRAALEHVRQMRSRQDQLAAQLDTAPEALLPRVESLLHETHAIEDQLRQAQAKLAAAQFAALQPETISDVPVVAAAIDGAPVPVLRELTDRFRNQHPSGVIVLASVPGTEPVFVAAVSQDLVERGLHAGELVRHVAQAVGGSGGGRPNFAQAGGSQPEAVPEALALVPDWVRDHLD